MKKLSILIFVTSFLFSCSKGVQNEIIENAQYLKEIVELSIPVDVDILNQYSYSSIANEYRGFSTQTTFNKEDSEAVVEINGFTLPKNKTYPNIVREAGMDNAATFINMFKDKAGQIVPLKLTKSANMEDITTNAYLPKTGPFDSKYDKSTNSLALKWIVDDNTQNNIMLVKLHYTDNKGNKEISNLKYDMSSGSAVVDLNSLPEAPKEFHHIWIRYIYGTAKIVETEDKKKVRIISIVMNNDIVYSQHKGE
jgi:hypothetical protein